MRSKSFGQRIADVLIEDGLLLPNQLEEAVGIQKHEGGRLLKILTDKQFVTEQDMAFSMGRCLNTPPINLAKLTIPEEIMTLVPREMAKANKLVPIARLNGKLFVAMADPTNVLAVDDLKRRVQLDIVPMIATERSVADALAGVHGGANMSQVLRQVSEEAAQTAESVEVQQSKGEEIDLDRLASDSEDAPVIKIVNLILAQAVKEKASDIHIEPFQHSLKLRYRVDGELMMAESPPKALQLAITSRIKILAGLNIAERRVPQDGRFRIKVMGKEVDLRISILPTGHGKEIRDNETADIAVKAALTGHQVLSTLHTNDAAGAITRLDDMGIEPFLISSSVLMSCAQRLVRRVCTNCRDEFIPEPEIFEKLGIKPAKETVFYHGHGCDRCKGRGYLGRAAIIEALPVTEAVRRLIIKRASAAVIKNQAVTEGMKTLRMVGLEKAAEGVTTLEEIWRVTSEDH